MSKNTTTKCPKCGGKHHPQNMCPNAPTALAKKIAASIVKPELVAALNELFSTGGWEIPDSAIEGNLTRRVEQQGAQIKSLTHRLLELQSKVEGKAPVSAGRVDVLATIKNGKKKK